MKKTITLTVLFSLFNALLFAQNKKISFGISVNPNYSYRYLYSDDAALKTTFDAIDVGKFSYSAGVFGEKEINNSVRFRVGVNFMNTGFGTKKTDFSSWGSQNPQGGWFPQNPDPNDPIAGCFIFNDLKIELPIDIQLFINKNKSFFIDLGISPLLNLDSYTTFKAYFADGRISSYNTSNNDPNAKKIALAAQFGIGYTFKLSQKLSMEIQPRCQSFLATLPNSRSKSSIIPYNLGLQMGLKF
jgi:hypothetical protein